MELWIRSQDKQSIMICKRITIIDNNVDACVINADNGTWDYYIGIYKTKERALEVLDEIQKLLRPISVYKQEADNLIIDYKNIDTVVYEMPQD